MTLHPLPIPQYGMVIFSTMQSYVLTTKYSGIELTTMENQMALNKYSQCPSCGGAMEWLYSTGVVETHHCADCQWTWNRKVTHDLVTADERMAEAYGE